MALSNPTVPPSGQQPPNAQPPYGQPPAYNMGYAPPSPPPKKPGMRWWGWVLIAGGVVLVACCGLGVVIVALSSANSNRTTTGTNSSSNGLTTSATATPIAPAKVGSTITDNGVSCTLVSAKVVQGDSYDKPDSGNVFVLVTVKIVNNSSSEFDYNPYDFNAESGSRNLTHPDFYYPDDHYGGHQLNDGALAAGGSVEGQIRFQVPKGDHLAKLTWQPGFFDDNTSNAWLLGL